MAGFSNITGQESIMYANNCSFDGTERGGKMTTDGQLWIGSSSSPHVRLGTISAGSGITVTNGPGTITIAADGGVVTETLTPDSGGVISPQAGNINVNGVNPSSATVTDTINSTGTPAGNLQIEHRAWLTPLVVDPSSTVGTRGTFTTIGAALTAASSGQTIFIRPGTYTEDLTLKAGVNLTAFMTDAYTPTVSIVGKATPPSTGTVNISGIQLTNNGNNNIINGISVSCAMNFFNCAIVQTGTTHSIVISSASSAAVLTFYNCNFSYGTNTQELIRNIGGATFTLRDCNVTGTGSGTKFNCNTTGDTLNLYNCTIQGIIALSSNGTSTFINTKVDGSTNNQSAVNAGNLTATNCQFLSGTAVAIVGGSGTQNIYNCIIDSTNTNPITTTGTLNYSGLVFSNTGITVRNSVGTVNVLPGQIVTITGSLTNAQIKALHGTPIAVIPAPGAGNVIQVISASAKMVYGGTNVFTAGAAQTINLYYGTATSIAAVLTNAEIVASATQYNGVNGLATFGGANTGFDNVVVNLYNPVATEITGNAANDNTVTYQITYQVVKI